MASMTARAIAAAGAALAIAAAVSVAITTDDADGSTVITKTDVAVLGSPETRQLVAWVTLAWGRAEPAMIGWIKCSRQPAGSPGRYACSGAERVAVDPQTIGSALRVSGARVDVSAPDGESAIVDVPLGRRYVSESAAASLDEWTTAALGIESGSLERVMVRNVDGKLVAGAEWRGAAGAAESIRCMASTRCRMAE
jgi:hypothetical protein